MNWFNNTAPSSIHDTVTYQSNYSELLQSNTIKSNSISLLSSDSTIGLTIKEGIIDSIFTINSDSDAVNKEYVINSKKPSGPIDSIQFNDNGVFNGSESLLFSGDFNRGTVVTKNISISDTVVVISTSQILNVSDPIYNDQLTSKNYIDNYANFTQTLNIDSSMSSIYSSITNTIVNRGNISNTNTDITDYVPTAENIMITLNKADISVKAASTINLVLSGLQTVDGVALISNDLILVKNQTNLKENGVYRVFVSNWVRIFQIGTNIFGLRIYVLGGTVNKNLLFTITNNIQYSYVGIDNITFKTIQPVISNTYYNFSLTNTSTTSSIILSSNTGVTIIHGLSPVQLFIKPTYLLTSLVNITSIIPPTISIIVTSIKPGVKYLDANFIDNTFQTNLAYRITNTLMLPGNSTVIQNTNSGYLYTSNDVSKNIVIRNPASGSNDGIDNLLTTSSFIVQNISANSINISGTNSSGIWVFDPSPIIIGPNSTQKIILYTDSGINYATGLGQMNF